MSLKLLSSNQMTHIFAVISLSLSLNIFDQFCYATSIPITTLSFIGEEPISEQNLTNNAFKPVRFQNDHWSSFRNKLSGSPLRKNDNHDDNDDRDNGDNRNGQNKSTRFRIPLCPFTQVFMIVSFLSLLLWNWASKYIEFWNQQSTLSELAEMFTKRPTDDRILRRNLDTIEYWLYFVILSTAMILTIVIVFWWFFGRRADHTHRDARRQSSAPSQTASSIRAWRQRAPWRYVIERRSSSIGRNPKRKSKLKLAKPDKNNDEKDDKTPQKKMIIDQNQEPNMMGKIMALELAKQKVEKEKESEKSSDSGVIDLSSVSNSGTNKVEKITVAPQDVNQEITVRSSN